MPSVFAESDVEEATLDWFVELGYARAHGPDLAPDGARPERTSYAEVVLRERLRAALARINPQVPASARDEAERKVLRAEHPDLVERNRHFHRLLVDGVDVDYHGPDGRLVHDKVWLLDFADPARNDWLVVNQFTVYEPRASSPHQPRRPDVVVFVNGLPLGVIELKNPQDPNATLKGAFNQLQGYKREIAELIPYNAVLAISDGVGARLGTLTSEWERFLPWRTIDGDALAPRGQPELEVLVKGVFAPHRLLDLVQQFTVFEVDGPKLLKKIAAYHQYHAVRKAVACTVDAADPGGDRRVGVVWHTQGSGKSLTMVFYAGKLVREPALANPTLVVLTDRNDLDDQLFGTFVGCSDLLRQTPVQADSRADLREKLRVAAGGIVFTTIQKFLPDEKGDRFPLLSDRRNVVVIADEAHRTQYGFAVGLARNLRDALPNASFIAFTGTPIEAADRSTRAVFGEYVDVYDVQRAVDDGATVPIYYEGRLAKLELADDERPRLDPEFEEVTEGEEESVKQRYRSKWARLEAIVGAEKRVHLIAADLVAHWENRVASLDGKAMIVCMSRRICVALYDALIRLRPDWHADDDREGRLKVVMTGSLADPVDWHPHVRNKARRRDLGDRFKDPADPLQLVIVRDMWLTGFDAPSLHTMYVDKPMQGHGLMQAIARVNRVFRDKPGGLVVDYLGLADQLKRALASYTETDRRETGIPQETAVLVLREKHEVLAALLHGFDWSAWHAGRGQERLRVVTAAMDFLLQQPDGKRRFLQRVTELSKAFVLAVPHDDALALRDDVAFFQAVRGAFLKHTPPDGRTADELDTAIRQLVSKAIVADGVMDIFAAAGLQAPDVSILSDEFLEEVRELPQRNLAVELLRKLLNEEIKARGQRNAVQARSFADMLERSIQRYQNRSIEAAAVIAELIELAKEMRAAHRRGEALGLTEDELAFYDALEAHDTAVAVLGDETLRTIARELVDTVRRNVGIDWAVRESARARLRTLVKRVLRKHGYPPDKQEQATLTVLQQAELLSETWAA
jgi:type I restriction enzyme R subunit